MTEATLTANDIQTQLLHHAQQIAHQLLQQAYVTGEHAWWESVNFNVRAHTYNTVASDNIYSGTAGILLFFIAMHQAKEDPAYPEIIRKAADYLVWKTAQDNNPGYAFYTGRLGVSYALLEAADFLNDKRYITHALNIVRNCELYLQHPAYCADLLTGTSGTLIGLLHLYDRTREPWLLEKIELFTADLIKTATFVPGEGLSWYKNNQTMKNLCGFSHGASGMAFALMELGRYFNNDAYLWLGRQAVRYEQKQFDESTANWPDYRTRYAFEHLHEDMERLERGDKQYFFSPSNFVAWCHGASGIGLARARAYAITKNEDYLHDLQRALTTLEKRTFDKSSRNLTYTLCHGIGSDALVHAEASLVLNDPGLMDFARQFAEYAFKAKERENMYRSGFSESDREDTSLFMGIAGIGMFYLKLLSPLSVKTLLLPVIESKADAATDLSGFKFLSLKTKEMARHLFHTIYPLSTALAEKLDGDRYLEQHDPYDAHYAQTVVQSLAALGNQHKMIGELFAMESAQNGLANGNSYYATVRQRLAEKNFAGWIRAGGNFDEVLIALQEDVQLFKIEYYPDAESAADTPTPAFFVLMYTAKGPGRFSINEPCYELFNSFKTGASFNDALDNLIGKYQLQGPQQDSLRNYAREQVIQALKTGILVVKQKL
jgi:hypothetical protein